MSESDPIAARKALMAGRVIAFTLAIRASRERIWNALTDPEQIAQWSYPEAVEVDKLEVGGVYGFITDDAADEDGAEIMEWDPPSRFVFRWYSSEPQPTTVEYELEASGNYTLLYFRNSGFMDGPDWDKAYAEDFEGWVALTLALKELVEGQN